MKTSLGPFIVIHPEGDHERLCVLDAQNVAIEFYSHLKMATKNLFEEPKDANSFAADLAQQNFMAPNQVQYV